MPGPRTRTPLRAGSLEETLKQETRPVRGYLPGDKVHVVPKPTSPGFTVLITHGPTLYVASAVGSLQAVPISGPVTAADIDRITRETFLQVPELYGMEYFIKSVTSNGPEYPMLARESQRWVSEMNDADFERYQALYRDFAAILERKMDGFPFEGALAERWAGFRQTLRTRRELHDAWIIWGRSEADRGVSPLLERFAAVVSPDRRDEARTMLEPVRKEPSDKVWFATITEFLNRYASTTGWVEP